MADLANLLGGYGSGSEDDDASMGDAAGVLANAVASAEASPGGSRDPAAAAGGASPAGAASAEAAGGTPLSDAAAPGGPASPGAAPHVMDGPTTNPEPPPEGLSPPAPAASGSSGGAPGGGGLRRGDPLLMLPPELREAPPGPVDPVIQEKVALIDQVQRQKGVTVMSQLSKDRRWANPTFLDKMVAHFELDPYGTCFRPEVWDPKALPVEDTWSKLEEALKAAAGRRAEEAARRDQARRDTVQFQSSGLQLPAAPTAGLGPMTGRAPIGAAAAAVAAAAAAAKAGPMGAKPGGGAPPRAPISSSDPRVVQAQALAQALAAKGGAPAASGAAKRSKWDA